MNDTEQLADERLDALISKLERAAEQLRSGELEPGRGRDAGRGLRGDWRARPRPSSSSARAGRSPIGGGFEPLRQARTRCCSGRS